MAALPSGYFWSPKIQDPAPLTYLFREYWGGMQPGYYDFATMPFGDNWSLLKDGNAFTSVRVQTGCDVSFQPRFPVDEPSAGFFMTMRGPYDSPNVQEENRGEWQVSGPPAGMVWQRLSAPLYGHIGSRYDRYNTNGYAWLGEGWYPHVNNPYWDKGTPVGPKKFGTNDRVVLQPCQLGPDITIISNVDNLPVYVSITLVDMLGRETRPSTPLLVNVKPNTGTYGSYIGVSRNYPVPMGTCGVYVYAGYSTDQMYRQPVLDYIGSSPKYLWPIWLQQYILHSIVNTGIKPKPPTVDGVASILNSPQKQVVDGKKLIVYNESEYNLYCPFILPYDSFNFGRIIGNANKKCTFKHQNKWIDGRPLQTDIPMLYIQNQRDKMCDAAFQSDYAIAGVTFSDYSGGQGFSDTIERCSFYLSGPETYGFLIDERCSVWVGNHTASETRIKECTFVATTPVKIEGNQSAKIRFTNMCSFIPTGNTRYKANTVATIYACSPNDFDIMDIEGIGSDFGQARALVACACITGPPNVTLSEFFADRGFPVYVSFANYVGGKVQFLGGERINAHGEYQNWVRLVEAPTALASNVTCNGVRMTGESSAISFQLNQLSINSDAPVAEIVAPDETTWTNRGLLFEYAGPGNPAYYNFKTKKVLSYTVNYSDAPDSIKKVADVNTVPVANPGVLNKVKSFLFRRK